MIPENIYKKVGRRYVNIGQTFTGFPANGIWVVKDGSQNCIIQISDKNCKVPYEAIAVAQYKDECVKHISDMAKERFSYSYVDMANWTADFFISKLEKGTK
jgi:hypothetical protein